jgi:hypothetical protein
MLTHKTSANHGLQLFIFSLVLLGIIIAAKRRIKEKKKEDKTK